jgi:hypothetical protein
MSLVKNKNVLSWRRGELAAGISFERRNSLHSLSFINPSN